MLGAPADLLSLLYLGVALYTLWQLPGRWRALTDSVYTEDDRNLANRLGFLLLTPVGVLLHELAHMGAAGALGGRDISLTFRIYWGYVQYRGPLGPTSEWLVASAGPFISLLLGLAVGYLALGLRQPWRDVGMAFAHATLLIVLLLYPGLSVLDGEGDFRWIYSARTPELSTVAGVVHAAGLLAYVVLARRHSRLTRQETRSALSERFAGRAVAIRPEAVARLRTLEADERVRRLEPDERAELNHLRELWEWSEEHNRGITAAVEPGAGERPAPAGPTGPSGPSGAAPPPEPTPHGPSSAGRPAIGGPSEAGSPGAGSPEAGPSEASPSNDGYPRLGRNGHVPHRNGRIADGDPRA